MVSSKIIEISKYSYDSTVKLRPRYGYDIYFLDLYVPNKYDEKYVRYLAQYLGRALARLGISNSITIQRIKGAALYPYRILVSMNYPKGVRGLQRRIINIMDKLKPYGITGKFSQPTIHGYSLERTIYEI